jgi:uncharacterized protein YdeI (YjbR/CyaY-like superfamily)
MPPFGFSHDNSVVARTRAQWRAWLSRHHTRTTGVWLVTFKRASGKPHLEYNDAVEEALCFGWIDSRTAAVDDERGAQYFAPRRRGTGWSRSNKVRIDRLLAADLMTAAGLARIDAARLDGSWTRLDAVEALEIPRDLASAFRRHAGSGRYFDAFPRSRKRAILEWIATAKRPETRAKRMEETARLAARNIRANEWERSGK